MTSQHSDDDAAYVDEQVRQHDPDRYLTGMFAPQALRPSLFALYAFNAELARVRETVSEPMLGEIRLQWWRDAVTAMAAGEAAPHQPVAQALEVEVAAGRLKGDELMALIDARQPELYDEAPADFVAFAAWHEAQDGQLNEMASRLLGAGEAEAEAARAVGQAFGMVRALALTPVMAHANRLMLPQDRLETHAPRLKDMHAAGGSDTQRALMHELAGEVEKSLDEAKDKLVGTRPTAVSPLLLVRLAESDLNFMLRSNFDPGADPRRRRVGRLARLYWAGMRGKP